MLLILEANFASFQLHFGVILHQMFFFSFLEYINGDSGHLICNKKEKECIAAKGSFIASLLTLQYRNAIMHTIVSLISLLQ